MFVRRSVYLDTLSARNEARLIAERQHQSLLAAERTIQSLREGNVFYRGELGKIVDMETPGAASIGKRMAAVARKALGL
jgi:hypothetical protein